MRKFASKSALGAIITAMAIFQIMAWELPLNASNYSKRAPMDLSALTTMPLSTATTTPLFVHINSDYSHANKCYKVDLNITSQSQAYQIAQADDAGGPDNSCEGGSVWGGVGKNSKVGAHRRNPGYTDFNRGNPRNYSPVYPHDRRPGDPGFDRVWDSNSGG